MTPKKAIIVVLVLFLIMVLAGAFLYLKNQLAGLEGANTSAGLTDQEKLSPVQQKIKEIEDRTRQQVGQIVEQGKTASGGITVDAQRKIEAAVNQEIMEKIKLKTPEELKADEQRRAELDKIEQQVNQQIKDQLQNK